MLSRMRTPKGLMVALTPMAIIALIALAAAWFASGQAEASPRQRTVIPLVGFGPGAGSSGELIVEDDGLQIRVADARPNERFNVFLVQTRLVNRVPESWIGGFTTDSQGGADFRVRGFNPREAFAIFTTTAPNEDPTTGQNSCLPGPAGEVNCSVVRLDALRIYFADPTPPIPPFATVWDRDGEAGGLLFAGVCLDGSDTCDD